MCPVLLSLPMHPKLCSVMPQGFGCGRCLTVAIDVRGMVT